MKWGASMPYSNIEKVGRGITAFKSATDSSEVISRQPVDLSRRETFEVTDPLLDTIGEAVKPKISGLYKEELFRIYSHTMAIG